LTAGLSKLLLTVTPKLNEDHESSDEEEVMFLRNAYAENPKLSARKNFSAFHPPPPLILALWPVFLSNVDPMLKILHTPTVQTLILEASGDLNSITRPVELLIFAIFSAAVASMDYCYLLYNDE